LLTITDCINAGLVKSDAYGLGGIMGDSESGIIVINNCINIGEVEGGAG
jgi:hypothetical protein